MLQNILLDLRIGSSILKLRHIHIFQRELNPNLFRVDLALGKQDNRLHMAAPWKQIRRLGGLEGVAQVYEEGHIPGSVEMSLTVSFYPALRFRAATHPIK